MLRRSLFGLSSRRSFRRITRPIAAELIPPFSHPRKKYASAASGNGSQHPNAIGKEEKGGSSKLLMGTAVVAGAFLAAYQAGHLDQYLTRDENVSSDKLDAENKVKKVVLPSEEISAASSEESLGVDHLKEKKVEAKPSLPVSGDLNEDSSKNHLKETAAEEHASKFDEIAEESKSNAEGKHLPLPTTNDDTAGSVQPLASITELGSQKPKDYAEPSEDAAVNGHSNTFHMEEEGGFTASQNSNAVNIEDDYFERNLGRPASLLEEYYLKENASDGSISPQNADDLPKNDETNVKKVEDHYDGYMTKDGKLVLDFLAAIHAAEKRQEERDSQIFSEEKKALKEWYENELRDLRARELMRIEEAALLDKELKRERSKAAAAIKSIEAKMEEKLKTELEHKENEMEMKVERLQELAKAKLAATVASEKAAQIEKMAEANLHINALCMAFYARSEEARKSHSVHKLALGALALEDALSNGLPIQKQIYALQTYFESIEKDSVLDLVLSSLPEETRRQGTDTLLELNKEFDTLKKTLRHFSLIPTGGGGVLTHSLAYLASWLKVKEVDNSGDGIESIIRSVDDCLSKGKLAEAAEVLEQGVKGSQAEAIVGNWVQQARNRAIAEQALTLLESYATCASLT